jgi:hypothetical protein
VINRLAITSMRTANLLFLVLCTLVMALPATASAEIRTGTTTDPTGDSSGAPTQDITAAHAQLDSNGQLIVSATVNGDLAAGPATFFSFRVASYVAPNTCAGAGASIFGYSDDPDNFLVTVTGVSGVGGAHASVSGNTLTAVTSGTAFANKDWSCMTLSVSPKGQNGTISDQLNTPLFFNGFGPDTDGDGLVDNADQCSSQAGTPPTGCPAPATPTTAPATPTPPVAPTAPTPAGTTTSTCKPPKLKGKTLAAAKKALLKAHCKLGTVKRPKKVKKGLILVVSKQSGKGPKIAITLRPRKVVVRHGER